MLMRLAVLQMTKEESTCALGKPPAARRQSQDSAADLQRLEKPKAPDGPEAQPTSHPVSGRLDSSTSAQIASGFGFRRPFTHFPGT